ncbi:MAG: class I SAM-dependent methyltransferase [Planctomycetaceae bacterium]|nr:class I SAM-dependent methyltransferase [Planctomycetaceae bacterium]
MNQPPVRTSLPAAGALLAQEWARDHFWRRCPICDSDNRPGDPLPDAPPPWRLKSCRSCNFVYLENPPGYQALEHEFAWERTWAAEAARRQAVEPWLHRVGAAAWAVNPRRMLRPKMVRLVQHFAGGGNLLDLGCGKGRLGVAVGPAFVPYGVEISRELAAGAAVHFRGRGGDVLNCPALEGVHRFGPEFFAAVVMKSYLEHELQPREVLVATAQVMRPGGALVIKVPNFASFNRRVRQARWCGFRHPDHVNYFTPKSLISLVQSCGFEVARCGLRDRWPWSDNLWLVARKPAASRVFAKRV